MTKLRRGGKFIEKNRIPVGNGQDYGGTGLGGKGKKLWKKRKK